MLTPIEFIPQENPEYPISFQNQLWLLIDWYFYDLGISKRPVFTEVLIEAQVPIEFTQDISLNILEDLSAKSL